MVASLIVDTGFLVALLSWNDAKHRWAVAQAPQLATPWHTCDAVLSETFYLLGGYGSKLATLLGRRTLTCALHLSEEIDEVLTLMIKYADVPMSFAAACLVRMTEIAADPLLITLDAHFRIYRRHGNKSIPCVMPN
jgi:predicted nucleic acid-binding protein